MRKLISIIASSPETMLPSPKEPVVCTLPQDTVLNLSGPICINVVARIGLQIPQIDPRYPSHHRLGPDEGGQS